LKRAVLADVEVKKETLARTNWKISRAAESRLHLHLRMGTN
jgi:hypothetical protein